jgi:hypothetical protein
MRAGRRSFVAVLAAGALLFAQLAVSAFACPGGSMATMHVTVQAESMPGCPGMDEAPSPLCPAHCDQGQLSLDKPPVPGIAPAVLIGHVSWRAIEAPQSRPVAVQRNAHLIPPPEPPPAIRNCCLRI